jgi:hypothetical protein
MSVDVTTGAAFKSGPAKELFTLSLLPQRANWVYDWDVSADGSRFLRNVRGDENEAQAVITVVLNWTAGLKP